MVDERGAKAPEVQQVITRYGSKILSRSGIPSPSRQRGIITLTMEATAQDYQSMENELRGIGGVEVSSVHFAQPESFQVCEAH